jgi:hypothetical protein
MQHIVSAAQVDNSDIQQTKPGLAGSSGSDATNTVAGAPASSSAFMHIELAQQE